MKVNEMKSETCTGLNKNMINILTNGVINNSVSVINSD